LLQRRTVSTCTAYHRKEEGIRPHVLLCFLGLLLMRVAETKAKDTWRNIRRELQGIQLGEFRRRAASSARRAHPFSAGHLPSA
jgi:hypothetical protein